MFPQPPHQPSLTEEIDNQRAINQRLYEHSLKLDPRDTRSDTLIAIVRALALGHACVARLEREHKALTGGTDTALQALMAQALKELHEEEDMEVEP